jgi:hypothetical protein
MKHLLLTGIISLALVSCESSTTDTKLSSGTSSIGTQRSESNTPATPIICDIKKLAGKSPKQVQQLYGKPDASTPTTIRSGPCKGLPCKSYTYQHGRIEVVFINNKADWVTVNEVGSIPLAAEAIELLGLPATRPSFENPDNVIRWSSVSGIREISAFSNGSGGISYLYIHCQTPL